MVEDICLEIESISEVFREAKYQWCTVLFYRNLFSVVPGKQTKEVSHMLKEIHVQECKASAQEKA